MIFSELCHSCTLSAGNDKRVNTLKLLRFPYLYPFHSQSPQSCPIQEITSSFSTKFKNTERPPKKNQFFFFKKDTCYVFVKRSLKSQNPYSHCNQVKKKKKKEKGLAMEIGERKNENRCDQLSLAAKNCFQKRKRKKKKIESLKLCAAETEME